MHFCVVFSLLLTCYSSLHVYGLAILSGQNQSIYVILKKRGLSLSKYLILVPTFALNILINLYESFSVPQSNQSVCYWLLLEMLTNSPEDTTKTLWLISLQPWWELFWAYSIARGESGGQNLIEAVILESWSSSGTRWSWQGAFAELRPWKPGSCAGRPSS